MKPTRLKLLPVFLQLLALIACQNSSQQDSPIIVPASDSIPEIELPNADYSVMVYDSTLEAEILTYVYDDLIDLDQDGVFDQLTFVGNGGAHQYFHFQLELSTLADSLITFPTFLIDMPYYSPSDTVIDKHFPQFSLGDFDQDQHTEIYLNIDTPFGSIPEKLAKAGVNSTQIYFDYSDGKLLVKNYSK